MSVIILFSVMLLSSCASVVNGPVQKVTVVSDPPGAEVFVDGVERGTTPVVLTLPRKEDHVLQISKAGYHNHEAHLKRTLSGLAVFYLLPGGFLSLGIDAASGAQYKLPDKVNVELKNLFHAETVLASQMNSLKAVNAHVL